MKKVFFPLATVALLAATTSCSHDQELDMKFDSKTEIRPTASVIVTGVSTRAGEDEGEGNFETRTEGFEGTYAVTAFMQDNDGEETATTHFWNASCKGGKFDGTSYYFPSDDTKLNFYAYAPISGTYNNATHKINWDLDGQQDIVWAKSTDNHCKTSGNQPKFTFAHKLAYLTINIAKGDGFQDNIEIKSVEILDVQTDATLDLREGKIGYGATKEDLEVPVNDTFTRIGTTAAYGTIMLPAGVKTYTVRTKTKGHDGTTVTYADVTLKFKDERGNEDPNKKFEEGNEYEVTLTFKGTEISDEGVKITQWDEGGSLTSDVQ